VEQWETDRLRFIGRGRSVARPALAMRGAVGNVLDPIFSLRTTIELASGEEREIAFLLGAVQDTAKIAGLVPQSGPIASPVAYPADNACGVESGFTEDSSEYLIKLAWKGDALELPPMPWVNVIANQSFGTLVGETGAACTWARNSQANRLTPWTNDPVSDPHREALYLRDDASGVCWSPLPGPLPAPVAYEVRHGFGYSRFAAQSNGLEQQVTTFVAKDAPVKFNQLRLTNVGGGARSLSLYAYQQLVLGSLPKPPGAVRTWLRGNVLCAANDNAGDFAGGIAFTFAIGAPPGEQHWTCDRTSFIGKNGSARTPKGLEDAVLDGSVGAGLDPCFARQLRLTLEPGQTVVVAIALGEVTSEAQLGTIVQQFGDNAAVDAALEEVTAFWKSGLGGVKARTPSPEIDSMVNGWLAYQALACRIWARTAFYQSSGAYGFRDQLQDAGNLSLLWPDLTRRQILLHAAHQFEEGDVLHWWHPEPIGRGVRTRFADDLLWLPFVTDAYVQATGDAAIWDESAPFLRAPVLADGEEERYIRPDISSEHASLYEHCCRAIDRSLKTGVHGLPLMGTGDWNDGMNRVGFHGRGESVWLGFFLYSILDAFIPQVERRGDTGRAERYAGHRDKLDKALNDGGWDGSWYRRAYYDDGTPLGTHDAAECRIDGLAQSWAVLSGVAPPERAAQALDAAEAQLIDEKEGLIRLLTPPFVDTPHDPGYIKGYVAGVRENGGQYTHAACWMIQALARNGRRHRAARLLEMLSPLSHTRPAALPRYKVEPYVVAADVYGAEPHIGRGGWTWYTGSAGWAYRAAVESVLGLRTEGGNTLVLEPCVPDEWSGYTLEYRCPGSGTLYTIAISNPGHNAECVVAATVDRSPVSVSGGVLRVPMAADGSEHQLVVTLGKRTTPA
jgi:cyclic beta-1,2-glucan synthetase